MDIQSSTESAQYSPQLSDQTSSPVLINPVDHVVSFSTEDIARNNSCLAKNMKKYFRNLVHTSKYSIKKCIQLGKDLKEFFADSLKDNVYVTWLAK